MELLGIQTVCDCYTATLLPKDLCVKQAATVRSCRVNHWGSRRSHKVTWNVILSLGSCQRCWGFAP